jgi:predicted aconitase
MLEGQHGATVQRAMELLTKVGDAHDAQRMLDVSKAYILFPPDRVSKNIGRFTQELLDLAKRFRQ